MKPILLASSFLLAVVPSASAQQVVPAPVPSQVRPTPLPAPAPFIVPDLHFDFHYEVPPFPPVTWTSSHEQLFDLRSHVETGVTFAMAQKDQPFVVTTQGKGPFGGQEGSQIDAAYSQARSFIDRDQYSQALNPLERVITAKGARADAATYWKAYSLLKLARRDEALMTLGQMQKQFPDSAWLRDARALEVEVKQAAGQSVATNSSDDDVKLLALQSIMRTDPDAALPVVEKMLAGGASVRLKERALFVVSQNRTDRARQVLGNVARSGSNPDLQLLAIRYLGQSNTPEAIAILTTVYRGDNSLDVKRAIISALGSSRGNAWTGAGRPTGAGTATGAGSTSPAITALVTIGRAERNPELKALIVRHLSNSTAPEAKGFMLEILDK